MEPKRLTWIVIGDLSKIEAKVCALNYGVVKVLNADGEPAK